MVGSPDILNLPDSAKEFNPLSEKSIGRLRKAIERGFRNLKIARDKRVEIIKQYTGKHYGGGGSTEKVPVNLIDMCITVYLQWIVATAPAVSVTSPHEELKAFANSLELGLNHLYKEINFGNTLRLVALDALFGIGIIKSGLSDEGMQAVNGENYAVQQPFADRVDLDDFVYDPEARSLNNCDFLGNVWRCPYDVFMETKEFENKENIRPDEETFSGEKGKRARDVSKNQEGATDEPFKSYINLIDVYLPFDGLIVTMPYKSEKNKALRVREYEGADNPSGPYHILGFGDVPDNIMPLAPVSVLRDLHDLANRLYRKASRQAERQKEITAYTPAAAADMERVKNASDGESVQVSHTDQIKTLNYGAANPMTQAMFLQSKDIFAWLSGNLDALGGLGPMSETARQDQLMSDVASMRMKALQARMYDYVEHITNALAWNLMTLPMLHIPIAKQVPGLTEPMYIPTELSAVDMRGDYLSYNFKIEPHSMQPQTPEKKLQALMQILPMYQPFLPIMQAQGVMFDMEKLTRRIAKLGNLPELAEVIVFQNPQEQLSPMSENHGATGKPTNTTRRYERINRPGGTRQGKEAAMIQTLLGQGVQQSEAAGMTKSTG